MAASGVGGRSGWRCGKWTGRGTKVGFVSLFLCLVCVLVKIDIYLSFIAVLPLHRAVCQQNMAHKNINGHIKIRFLLSSSGYLSEK